MLPLYRLGCDGADGRRGGHETKDEMTVTLQGAARPTRRAFLAATAGLAAAGVAGPADAAFTAPQAALLQKISDTFNAIRTMQGRFIQYGPNGEQSDGVFFISRPGKLRFHYSPPVRMDVICDGSQVSILDAKVMTQDLYPLSKTPLRHLLAERIDLTSSNIVRRMSEESDLISLVLAQSSNFGDGSLKLIFDSKTLQLRQWVITDAQGLDTSVAIYDVETGRPADPKNFKIDYYLPNTKN